MVPPYSVLCYQPGCGRPAVFKIASRWSDGVTEELKTYALSCDDCLAEHFRRSCDKQAGCRRARGESLEPPGIYRLERGRRDRLLERMSALETQLRAAAGGS